MREPTITIVRIADKHGKIWTLPYHDYTGVVLGRRNQNQQSIFDVKPKKKHTTTHKKKVSKYRDEFSHGHGEVKIIKKGRQ